MPYPNFHSARQREPSAFIENGMGKDATFKTIQITKGVTAIIGKLKKPPKGSKKESTFVQTYRFDKNTFTATEAKKWLKDNKAKTSNFEEAEEEKKEQVDMTAVVLNEDSESTDSLVLDMLDESEEDDLDEDEDDLPVADKKDEAKLKGSYEELRSLVDVAINDNSHLFGGSLDKDTWFSIYALFPKEVIVTRYSYKEGDPTRYFQASYKKDKDDKITLSDSKEVVLDTTIKPKTEQVITDLGIFNEHFTLSTEDGTLLIEEVVDKDGNKVTKGKVPIAQKANSRNRNNRVYLSNALQEAVADAKTRLPLLMEAEHRIDEKGRNKRDLEKTVAVIHKIEWHPETETVSLDDITFVETQSGKNVTAVLKGGAKLQVSQRGTGKSEVAKWSDGKLAEMVTKVRFDGYDFTPPGEASVVDADFHMTEAEMEGEFDKMLNGKVLTADETKKLVEDLGKSIEANITKVIKESLKPAEAEPKVEEKPEEMKPKDEKKEEKPKVEDKEETAPKVEDPKPDAELAKKLSTLEERVNKDNAKLDEITKEREKAVLKARGSEVLKEILASDDYKRFKDAEKAVIEKAIDPLALYGRVDIDDAEKLKEGIDGMVKTESAKIDQLIAAVKLRNTGFPDGLENQDKGKTVQVISEQVPGAEVLMRMTEDVEFRLKKENPNEWILPESHPAQKVLKAIMDEYYAENRDKLSLLEAGENVTQSDIGVRAASIAAVAIPAAFRRLTALQVVNVGTMTKRIEDIPIKAWLPAETSGRIDTDMAAVEIAEGGTIATAGITYTNYPAYAMRKALRTYLSPESYATAKGTGLNPEADSIAGLVEDIKRRLDRLLWILQIAKAQSYATTQQTTFTAMTHLGSNIWGVQSGGATLRGWVKFEWVKSVDANGNPDGASLIPLFDTPSDNTLQDVQIQEAGDDNTDLVYETDYLIDWASGTIELTTAGQTAEAGNGLQAKFTRSTNIATFSRIPDAGVTLYDHLVNLRQAITDAKVQVGNRHYDPSFVSMSLEIEALLTNGRTFTELGRTPADTLDQLNNVVNFAGLNPIKTSAMPYTWMLIGQTGAGFYYIQVPWKLDGPVINEDTGNKYWLAEEYSATDVPVSGKLSLVAITDLNQFE